MATCSPDVVEILLEIEQLPDIAAKAFSAFQWRGQLERIQDSLARLEDAARVAAIRAQSEAESAALATQAQAAAARQALEVDLAYKRLAGAQKRIRELELEALARNRIATPNAVNEANEAGEASNGPACVRARSANTNAKAVDVKLATSQDITATLRRMHQMAQGEVLKSEMNVMELDTSSRTLESLTSRYSAVDTLLDNSRKAVHMLTQADAWDRRFMYASLSFLVAVVFWIVWRRVLRGPLKLVLWTLLNSAGLVRRVASLAGDKRARPAHGDL